MGLAALLLYPVMVHGAGFDTQKIAVASGGKTVKSSVSTQAAKCPYYLIFDNQRKLIEVLDNPYMHARRGAGPSAAHLLAKRGATMVIAGNFGSKMVHTLKSKNITHFQFKGSVVDAVKKALDGSK